MSEAAEEEEKNESTVRGGREREESRTKEGK